MQVSFPERSHTLEVTPVNHKHSCLTRECIHELTDWLTDRTRLARLKTQYYNYARGLSLKALSAIGTLISSFAHARGAEKKRLWRKKIQNDNLIKWPIGTVFSRYWPRDLISHRLCLFDWLAFFSFFSASENSISECSLRGRVGLVRLSLCESGSHNYDVPRARNGFIVDGMCQVRRGMSVHRPRVICLRAWSQWVNGERDVPCETRKVCS